MCQLEPETASQKQQGNDDSISSHFLKSTVLWKRPLMVVLSFLMLKNAFSQSLVETLPGFDGRLPFKLETGYIGVGENEEVQLFYSYIESENDPVNDPLIFWLSGGPGCSGFTALIFEIGPLSFDYETFDESFPSLRLNPYSWTKMTSIIFVDSPAGTGYSYSKTSEGYHSSDTKVTEDLYTFLRKWLLKHPDLLKNRLYIGGDSYGGKWVPMLTWKISSGNEAGLEPFMLLEGFIIGNPYVDQYTNAYARLVAAHRLALISDKYFQMAMSSCDGNYLNPNPNNSLCTLALQQYNKCTSNIYIGDILEPTCNSIYEMPEKISKRNILEDRPSKILQEKTQCRQYLTSMSEVWSNNLYVQEALHIRKGTIKKWVRCNDTLDITSIFDKDQESVFQYHHLLSKKRYHTLIYSGDHDLIFPYIGTLDTIYKLNLTLDDDWREWTVDGEVAGYTMRFKEDESGYYLTFATVKGAGHTAPEYKPKECFAMLERFIYNYQL